MTALNRSILILGALLCSPLLSSTESRADSAAPAHHGDRGYRNLHAEPRSTSVFSVLRSRFFSGEWQRYDRERDVVPIATPEITSGPSENATITWVGHATVLIQHRGINVLTDPMFSKFASPLSFAGPKRITAPAIALEELPTIHAVVISHDHYDHLDTGTIKALGNDPQYFVPLGVKRWFVRKGIDAARVTEMDWWDKQSIEVNGEAVVITATPSQHFSGRTLTDRNRTLWAAWGIAWRDFQTWFGGDTGYNDVQFKDIGARLGPIDLAIIPIGAYKPREMMGPVHVDPAEAVQIHTDLNAAASMAIHWGAFILSAEGVLTPPQDLAAARQAAGVTETEFAAWAVGETRHFAARDVREPLAAR